MALRSRHLPMILLTGLLLWGCGPKPDSSGSEEQTSLTTTEILVTSAAGDRLTKHPNVSFKRGKAAGVMVQVFPDQRKQTIDGIGSSFTEASAFVLAHLDPGKRSEVMEKVYGEAGANFSLTRTHIASCDFTVEGKYTYAPTPDDRSLQDFSIAPDLAGFDPEKYPGIRDRKVCYSLRSGLCSRRLSGFGCRV